MKKTYTGQRMKEHFDNFLDGMFDSWKTTMAGVVTLASTMAMLMGTISGETYLGILGFLMTAGFLVSKDADKKDTKEDEI